MDQKHSTEPPTSWLSRIPATAIVSSLLVGIGAGVFYYGGTFVNYLKQRVSSEPTNSIVIKMIPVVAIGIAVLTLLNIAASYLVRRKVRAALRPRARHSRTIKKSPRKTRSYFMPSFLQSMLAGISMLPFLLLIFLFAVLNSSAVSLEVRVAGNSFLFMFLVLNFIHWLDVKTKSRL